MSSRMMVCLLVGLLVSSAAVAKPKGKKEKRAAQRQAAGQNESPEDNKFKINVSGSAFDNKPDADPSGGAAPAVRPSPFKFAVATHQWKRRQGPIKLAPGADTFCLLSSLAGSFRGFGESAGIAWGIDNHWYLYGKTQQPLAAEATTVASPLRLQFMPQPAEVKWRKGQPDVKMIHHSKGLCVLAGVSGKFQGLGERVRVFVNPDDGFWYLQGRSQQPLAARAIAVPLRKDATVKLQFQEHRWARGRGRVKLIHADEGFCFLSSVGGNFAGFGEKVRVHVGDDGFWYLEGRSQQPLVARAISVRVSK